MKDAKLSVTKAFPAAGANNNTDAIDLGPTNNPNSIKPDSLEVEVVVPAVANLADAKNLDIKLQDSEDNATFADVDPLTICRRTGAGGAGAAAKTFKYRLPAATRRYIRWNQAVDAAGGDITAASSTINLITH